MKKEKGGLRVVSLMAILVLALIMAIASTFSWYNRPKSADGESYKLTYTQSGRVNNVSGAEAQTFAGTNENGVVTYSDVAVSASDPISAESGKVNYFKTVISDTAHAGDSLVSLYLPNLTCTKDMGASIHIGIIGPEKTYKPFTGTVSGDSYVIDTICIEDNILLAMDGTVEVYWFVEVDAEYTGEGSISLATPYIVYN